MIRETWEYKPVRPEDRRLEGDNSGGSKLKKRKVKQRKRNKAARAARKQQKRK